MTVFDRRIQYLTVAFIFVQKAVFGTSQPFDDLEFWVWP